MSLVKVKATRTGYYANTIHHEGSVFDMELSDVQLKNASASSKELKSVKGNEKLPSWVQLVEAPEKKVAVKAPAKPAAGKPAAKPIDSDSLV